MKEISRRVMSNSNEGIACGSVSLYRVDVGIVVEEKGQIVSLLTQ